MSFKRLLAFLLSASMIVSVMPAIVFADETEKEPEQTSAVETTTPEETEESKEKEPEKAKETEPSESEKKEAEEPSETETEEHSESEEPEDKKPSESSAEAGKTEESKENDAVKGKKPDESQSVGKKNATIHISGDVKVSELLAQGVASDDTLQFDSDTTLTIDADIAVKQIVISNDEKLTIQGDHTLTVTVFIYATNGDITLNSGTVIVKANMDNSYSAITVKNLSITGGTLSVDMDSPSEKPVRAFLIGKNLVMTGGKIDIDLSSKSWTHGIEGSDASIVVSGGQISIITNSTDASTYGIGCDKLEVQNGKITVDVSSSSQQACGLSVNSLVVSGGMIDSEAKTASSNYPSIGFKISENASVTAGQIIAKSTSNSVSGSNGIEFLSDNGGFTISGGDITASGNRSGILIGKASAPLKINGTATITATGSEGNGIYSNAGVEFGGQATVTLQGKDALTLDTCAICAKGSITVADTLKVTTPAKWSFYGSEYVVIKNNDTGTYANKVVIETKVFVKAKVFCFDEVFDKQITNNAAYVWLNDETTHYSAGPQGIQINVEKGEEFTLTAKVFYTGYEFHGWYMFSPGTQGGTLITKNTTTPKLTITDDTWYYADFTSPRTEIKTITFTADKYPIAGKTMEECKPTVTVAEPGITVAGCSWVNDSGFHFESGHVFSAGEKAKLLVDYEVNKAYKLASDIVEKTTLNGMKTATYDLEDTSFTVDFTASYDIGGTETEVTDVIDMIYTGLPLIQQMVVKYNGTELTEGTDYTVDYEDNIDVGTATLTITGIGNYTGRKIITFEIVKASNTLAVKPKTATVKYKKLKKKNQTLSIFKALTFKSGGQGAKTYANVSGNKKITINKTTGKVTVKKKLKKGTYKVKIKVMAAGNTNYMPSGWKTVTVRIKVK